MSKKQCLRETTKFSCNRIPEERRIITDRKLLVITLESFAVETISTLVIKHLKLSQFSSIEVLIAL